jgi:hypothetical protein
MTSKSDITNIAKMELIHPAEFTPLEAEMHLPKVWVDHLFKGKPEPKDNNTDEESIPSSFYKPPHKICMAVDLVEEMTLTPGNDGEYNFNVNDGMDFLLYTYIFRMFPGYKVKEEYKEKIQIKWCHNLGHNFIQRIELIIDNDCKQTITSNWLDIYANHFMKKGFLKMYRKCIRDQKYSQDWTDHLLPCMTKTPIPFFYSKSRDMALPLFLTKNNSKVEIKTTLRNKISDLMKMRIRKDVDSDWIEIPFRYECVQGLNNSYQNIQGAPRVFSYYSKITDAERESWKEQQMTDNKNDSKATKKYYDDIIIFNPDRSCNPKDPFNEELSSKTPVRAIFWIAQNPETLKYNNYSNYTTNVHDQKNGEHPVQKVTYSYGSNSHRFKEYHFSHFDEMNSFYRGISPPYEKGYGSLFLSPDLENSNADIGPVYNKNTKVILNLSFEKYKVSDVAMDVDRDKLIENILAENDSNVKISDSNRYKVHVFLAVMKKIEYYCADPVKVFDGNEKLNA